MIVYACRIREQWQGRVSRRCSRFLVVQAARLPEARAGGPPAPRPTPLHQPETRSNSRETEGFQNRTFELDLPDTAAAVVCEDLSVDRSSTITAQPPNPAHGRRIASSWPDSYSSAEFRSRRPPAMLKIAVPISTPLPCDIRPRPFAIQVHPPPRFRCDNVFE